MHRILVFAISICFLTLSEGQEAYHVAINGDDKASGSLLHPLRTISAAALLAQPGDSITVHEGICRERLNPPRGGLCDSRRITYRAAPGEKVEIRGSEIIRGWLRVNNDTWKVPIPNCFFRKFNPYIDTIHGDWFEGGGRTFHTGDVYIDRVALLESPDVATVLRPSKDISWWFCQWSRDITTIWGQFKNADPNKRETEINVRQTIFYP
jgi:alpha-N-arabinofuranosidase